MNNFFMFIIVNFNSEYLILKAARTRDIFSLQLFCLKKVPFYMTAWNLIPLYFRMYLVSSDVLLFSYSSTLFFHVTFYITLNDSFLLLKNII